MKCVYVYIVCYVREMSVIHSGQWIVSLKMWIACPWTERNTRTRRRTATALRAKYKSCEQSNCGKFRDGLSSRYKAVLEYKCDDRYCCL